MKLFTGSLPALERALTYSSKKHEVTAQNLANADTPNYKGKGVSFKKLLDQSISTLQTKKTDLRHLTPQRNMHPAVVYTKKNRAYAHNGNNIDVDKEMADLAANQIFYSSLVESLNGKYHKLQSVIKGGK